MEQKSVELRDLQIGYRTRQATKSVASGITATIHAGELTCLLGANGVGKSTLLRTLSAFQPALSGDILIGGLPIDSFSDRRLARTIGVVLTERPDVQNMTAGELVAMGRSPYTGFWGKLSPDDEQVVGQAMQQVGIAALAERLVTTLSDGERQKVMIAKVLAQQTPVVYLDEPTAFLDYPSKADMLLLLRRIAREGGQTVFLSTHDLELALQAADRIWLMTADQGLLIGTARQLADSGALGRFVEHEGISFDRQAMTVRIEHC